MSRERTDGEGDFPCVTCRCDGYGCAAVTDVIVPGGDIDAAVEAALDMEGWTEERIDAGTFTGPDRAEYFHRCPYCRVLAESRELPASGPVLARYEVN